MVNVYIKISHLCLITYELIRKEPACIVAYNIQKVGLDCAIFRREATTTKNFVCPSVPKITKGAIGAQRLTVLTDDGLGNLLERLLRA